MMPMKLRAILIALCLCPLSLWAQCEMENTAFQTGERLEYKLYFNWKFVWINAGTATLVTESTLYQGKPAFRSSLLTTTSKRIDKFFSMRDTLSSVITTKLVPLYYRKGAYEGGKYRLNEVRYSYPQGNTTLDLLYVNPSGKRTERTLQESECIYDMMSMMLRARSFDGSQFKEGDRINFRMADGKDIDPQTLVYRGKKNFKVEGGDITYRCLVFSFVEKNGKKEKEVITFYITDDDNHLPVRLDMFLRFGVAKAYLKTAENVRNPQTSIVKQKEKK